MALAAMGCTALLGCRAQRPRQPEVRPVQVNDVSGYIEFVARQREDEQRSKVGTGRQTSKETIFEENLQLEADGYVYHPNLLEWTVAGLFGLVQEEFEDTFDDRRRTSSDDGTVLEFELDMHFLKKKQYPGTIYANRSRRLEPRPFQSSLETTTTNFGLVWLYVDEKTPTNIQFNYTDVRLDPRSDEEAQGRQRNASFRFETAYRFSDDNVLSLVYDHESVKEQPFQLDYESDEVTLSHRIVFGEPKRHRLDSELNYFDQRGTFNIERARWRELLRLQHTENLRTWYQLELLSRTQGTLSGVPPLEERSVFFSGNLEHQLYDSLTTLFDVYALLQDFKNGPQINEAGAQLNLDYRKKNPWGRLVAAYRARFDRRDISGMENEREVVDERHTFIDPEPVALANTRVRERTIVVTAENRFTLFFRGLDYRVFVVGDRTELRRVPTGRIRDGETVLVDYTFETGGNFTLDTVGQDLSLRQEFDFGLSPYYRLRWQDQTLSPSNAAGAIPDDITANVIGVEFERGPLRLFAEYEDRNSTITPFEAVRLGADYTQRLPLGATGSVRARWTDLDYQPPDERQTTLFTLEGRYRHPVTRQLTVEGSVLYRQEEDSLSGPDEGIDVDLSLEWDIRQTEVRVTYEFGQYEDDFAEDDNSALYVSVKRRF
jgi:hypothetical protein